MQKLHFIVNPISGKGNHTISIESLNSFFNQNEYEVSIDYSEYPKHAVDLTKKAIANNPDIIIACGGDGTINEIASELVNTNIKLGIIPIGSGNGLASNLNIPKKLEKALETIKKGSTTVIDVGKINEFYFFSNTGIGIDAEIIKKYHQSGKRTLISYVKSTLLASFSYKPKTLNYSIEKVSHKITPLLLFVSNSNEMGYNMSLTPNASISDGYLDLVIVPKLSLFKQGIFGFHVLSKKISKNKHITNKLIKEVSINLDKNEDCLIQIDGEHLSINTNAIQIQVLEKSLTVII